MTIRKSTINDLKKIHSIYVDAAVFKHRYDDYAWKNGFSEKGVSNILKRNETYCAVENNEIIAVFAIELSDYAWRENVNDAFYLHRIAVAKQHHGKNIGTKIILWAANYSKGKSKKYLRLDCNVDNKQLCKYYETRGFIRVKTIYFPDWKYNAALYQKTLSE